MSGRSLLVVYEKEEAFALHPIPAPNSGENKIIRSNIIGYPILEPFEMVHLVGFEMNLTTEEAKALKSIIAPTNSKLSFKDCSEQFIKNVKITLLISGFILDSQAAEGFQISASPKDFADGAAITLNSGKSNGINIWKDAVQSGEYEIIDQDELITEEDLIKPTPTLDCGTDGPVKKACKNCSCGLAELEAKGDPAAEAPKSSCGSCFLGDAFRCAKCPYRGLPAFEPGQQVSIPADFLEDDI